MSGDLTVGEKAAHFFDSVIKNYHAEHGLGYMSCSIYDTAWVAMLRKASDGYSRWVFPESFHYIIVSQIPGGGWISYASEIDGILNTLAALLCLCSHAENPYQLEAMHPEDMAARMENATASLRTQLEQWAVKTTDHVGFEILVPAILELLEKYGVTFRFPGRDLLFSLRDRKLSKFQPRMLYDESMVMAAAIHSLEGFIGKIDFNELKNRKVFGSMMASPSSTVAYLLNSTVWDDEAEAYLRKVLEHGQGKSSGGVPSAFPSTYFELNWLVSTLLEAGYDLRGTCEESVELFVKLMRHAFEKQNGLIGFAPLVGVDADDTAKAIVSLSMLGVPVDVDRLIEQFDTGEHFSTYALERNPSFTTNCNALRALISVSNPAAYSNEIERITQYICRVWAQSNANITDKWNLSIYYPMMLMVQALQHVLLLWDQDALPSLPQRVIRDKVIIVLFQALFRTLRLQNANGSWGGTNSSEESAYAVILLSCLADLPCAQILWSDVECAIEKGRSFIVQTKHDTAASEYLWIEKVTYGSDILRQAYIFAALKDNVSGTKAVMGKALSMFDLPTEKISKFMSFYSKLPMFQDMPSWFVRGALVEGYLLLPQLQEVRLGVFSRQGMAEDRYFEYIPFTWAAANGIDKSYLGTDFIYQMNVISFLNYQIDEYMEAVIGEQFADRLNEIRIIIDEIFHRWNTGTNGRISNKAEEVDGLRGIHSTKMNAEAIGSSHPNQSTTVAEDITKRFIIEVYGPPGKISTVEGVDNQMDFERPQTLSTNTSSSIAPSETYETSASSVSSSSSSPLTLESVNVTLSSFVSHILSHTEIRYASSASLQDLALELRTFLLAHLTQIETSRRLYLSPSKSSRLNHASTPPMAFFTWARSIGADHTSCSYSFAFASCLLSSSCNQTEGKSLDLFPTATSRYLAKATAQHLASLCRMYNDFGSLNRDRAERNLNSVDFPELKDHEYGSDGVPGDAELKARLMKLAELEREFLSCAKRRLEREVDTIGGMHGNSNRDLAKRFVDCFVRITDCYGQIYVVKDIASRMK